MVLATPDRNPLRDSHRALRDRRQLRREVRPGMKAGPAPGRWVPPRGAVSRRLRSAVEALEVADGGAEFGWAVVGRVKRSPRVSRHSGVSERFREPLGPHWRIPQARIQWRRIAATALNGSSSAAFATPARYWASSRSEVRVRS